MTTIAGVTPVIVFTTMAEGTCSPAAAAAMSGMMKFFPAKNAKLPSTRTLSTNGSMTLPKWSFDLPLSRQISIKEIGEQRDDIDEERDVQERGIAAALVLVPREHGKEHARQQHARAREQIWHVSKHEFGGGLYGEGGCGPIVIA
jgi:hypothetical protein